MLFVCLCGLMELILLEIAVLQIYIVQFDCLDITFPYYGS